MIFLPKTDRDNNKNLKVAKKVSKTATGQCTNIVRL